MKKNLILCCLLLTSIVSISQEKENEYPQDINKKNELKLDAFSLIVFSSFDITYERLLNKDSSFGVSLFYNFNDIDSDLYFPKKFSLTPYYRWFFTESRFARGFFIEGFGMLNTYEDEQYFWGAPSEAVTATGFALGISVGGKFITKSGFTAEVFAGVGRNIFQTDEHDVLDIALITRGGISLGYRF